MRFCKVCKKPQKSGNGSFFTPPKGDRKKYWADSLKLNLQDSDVVCSDHFLNKDWVRKGEKSARLLKDAIPVHIPQEADIALTVYGDPLNI